jgi:UDP:flavonoid glycosyltransferase YjiC (YdhE family)
LEQHKSRSTIVIMATGSRGDVQPYIGLGMGLARAGHEVRIVTSREFEPLVSAYGLHVACVDIDVRAALRSRDASAAIESGGVIRSFRKLSELAGSASRLLVETTLDAARSADLIIYGLGGILVGSSVAEKLGLPVIQAYNVPLTPTAEFAGALTPWLSFPPRALTHRLGHMLAQQVLWQTARASGNRARVQVLALPPAPLYGIRETPGLRNGPVLYGFSPSVLPRPADWEERIQVTGYWFTDEPHDWTPPIELLEFLNSGPTPVYIGFGSMTTERPEEMMRLVFDALNRHSRRAIVQTGWAGLAATEAPENVYLLDAAPHSWLFPRMAAVVHHGGAGTTAAAFRAGVPAVVIPFHGDQPFWAAVTAQLGVGPRPIPRRRLSADRMAAAIEEALDSEEMQRRAAELGRRVRAEDGVGKAGALIESFLHNAHRQ